MDMVERHIERLKVAIERHDHAVELASTEFRSGVGAAEKEYERACIATARRILGPDRSMAISGGKRGELALMGAAKGRFEYDDAERLASANFDAEMLSLELARDDTVTAADKTFLLEEEEIHQSKDEDDKPQPPRKAA